MTNTEIYQREAVYEFRPLADLNLGPLRRYAGGSWIADDGEYDIAFINETGTPICLYVDPGHQKNILFGWYDRHWGAHEPRHPRGNAWHYALRDGAKDWGGSWDRDNHENSRAGRAGMNKVCSERGCANGRGIETTRKDPHVLAGLVRNRDTKAVLVLPDKLVCMFCGDEYKPEGGGK